MFTADHVVLATNFNPENQYLSKEVAHGSVPTYTYILVTKPVSWIEGQEVERENGKRGNNFVDGELGKVIKLKCCADSDRSEIDYFRPLPG